MTKEEESTLKEYRTELVSLLDKSNSEFNKQFSYISSAGIGLSLLVAEKLFSNLTITNHKWLLISCWVGFTACLLINLLSQVLSFEFHYKTIEDIDEKKYDYLKADKRNRSLRRLKLISVILLLIGISVFVTFVAINLYS